MQTEAKSLPLKVQCDNIALTRAAVPAKAALQSELLKKKLTP